MICNGSSCSSGWSTVRQPLVQSGQVFVPQGRGGCKGLAVGERHTLQLHVACHPEDAPLCLSTAAVYLFSSRTEACFLHKLQGPSGIQKQLSLVEPTCAKSLTTPSLC